MIVYRSDEYFKRIPIEKQKVCGNCRNRQIEPSRCTVNGKFLSDKTVFYGWCRRWEGDKE